MPRLFLNSFPGLPDIPKEKIISNKSTKEQDIFYKLLNNKPVSNKEMETYKRLLAYYGIVIPLLEKIDFTTFSKDDFYKFEGYLNSVLSFNLVSFKKVPCTHIVRIVRNEAVLGKRDNILNSKYLTYPPVDIVKKIGKYNRASDNKTTLFYGTDFINSALVETRPEKGELITVGIWENQFVDKNLILYAITFGKEAQKVNAHVRAGYQDFIDAKEHHHELPGRFMEVVFDFFGREYSKLISHHLEYYYSAYVTKKVLNNWQIDYAGVIYPSVQNAYKHHNVAIKPEVINKQFMLSSAIEMVIKDADYSQVLGPYGMFDINYVTPEYLKFSKAVNTITGDIDW